MNVNKYMDELIEVIKSPKVDKLLLKEFLKDVLTPKEYADIGIRWQVIKSLAKGEPQRDIAQNLGISTATITRGSKELLNKVGGFRMVLDKLNIKISKTVK